MSTIQLLTVTNTNIQLATIINHHSTADSMILLIELCNKLIFPHSTTIQQQQAYRGVIRQALITLKLFSINCNAAELKYLKFIHVLPMNAPSASWIDIRTALILMKRYSINNTLLYQLCNTYNINIDTINIDQYISIIYTPRGSNKHRYNKKQKLQHCSDKRVTRRSSNTTSSSHTSAPSVSGGTTNTNHHSTMDTMYDPVECTITGGDTIDYINDNSDHDSMAVYNEQYDINTNKLIRQNNHCNNINIATSDEFTSPVQQSSVFSVTPSQLPTYSHSHSHNLNCSPIQLSSRVLRQLNRSIPEISQSMMSPMSNPGNTNNNTEYRSIHNNNTPTSYIQSPVSKTNYISSPSQFVYNNNNMNTNGFCSLQSSPTVSHHNNHNQSSHISTHAAFNDSIQQQPSPVLTYHSASSSMNAAYCQLRINTDIDNSTTDDEIHVNNNIRERIAIDTILSLTPPIRTYSPINNEFNTLILTPTNTSHQYGNTSTSNNYSNHASPPYNNPYNNIVHK